MATPVLTKREREVLQLVARGMTNAEIGERLGLSRWTVKRHVARILAKTGNRRRIDLAVWLVRFTEVGDHPESAGSTGR